MDGSISNQPALDHYLATGRLGRVDPAGGPSNDKPAVRPVSLVGHARPVLVACSNPRAGQTISVAGLHLVTIAAVCLLVLPHRTPEPQPELAMPVFFVAPAPTEPAAPPQTLASEVLPVPTLLVPADLAPIPPLALQPDPNAFPPRSAPQQVPQRRARAQHEIPKTPVLPTKTPQPAALIAAAPQTPSTPQAVMQAAPSGQAIQALEAGWEARVRQAIQNALEYPAAARLMHREGRAEIRFDYEGGTAAHASVARSSNLASLDNAALAAVNRAVLPPPPSGLGGQNRTLTIGVDFSLSETK